MVQLSVHKANVIADEKERDAALAVVDARRDYYGKLFADGEGVVDIRVRYEGSRPLRIQIQFAPHGGAPTVIEVSSYKDAVAATKYAFTKLRRVAKNHFVKTQRRDRRTRSRT